MSSSTFSGDQANYGSMDYVIDMVSAIRRTRQENFATLPLKTLLERQSKITACIDAIDKAIIFRGQDKTRAAQGLCMSLTCLILGFIPGLPYKSIYVPNGDYSYEDIPIYEEMTDSQGARHVIVALSISLMVISLVGVWASSVACREIIVRGVQPLRFARSPLDDKDIMSDLYHCLNSDAKQAHTDNRGIIKWLKKDEQKVLRVLREYGDDLSIVIARIRSFSASMRGFFHETFQISDKKEHAFAPLILEYAGLTDGP